METAPRQEMAVTSQEAYLLSIMHSLWKNRCIAVIIDLKIPELLCNSEKSSMSIEEIAAKSGCQTSTQLFAVMGLLAKWGIGKEMESKHFAKNESMELLRRDKGPSLGHMLGFFSSDEQCSALRSLGACVKQGKPSFVLSHGMDHFTYMYDLEKCYDQAKMFEGSPEHKIGSDERRKEFAENYSSSMAKVSSLAILPNKVDVKTVYNVFPWSTCRKLVDVGGSLGGFLASILKLPGCEHIQGYVLDLPNVVKEAKSKIQDLGIPERRIEFVNYDFTNAIFPSDLDLQADTVIFKSIICMYVCDHKLMTKILRNCCNLFSAKGGRLLIIDYMVGGMDAEENGDNKVGINGLEYDGHSIHWLNVGGFPLLTKQEWMENLKIVGEELGYQMEAFHDTFVGGQVIFEFSYKPN